MNQIPSDLSRRRFLMGIGATGFIVTSGGLLAACGDDSGSSSSATTAKGSATTAAAGAKKGLIGLTLNGLNDYTRGVATGAYKAIEGTGYTLEVVQVEYDSAKELAAIENFIAKGAVGIVIQPNTTESAGAGAKAAKAKNIPVGNCLWPGKSDADQYFNGVAQLDSVAGGKLIGEYLIKAKPEGGKIVVVQGVIGQGFSERIDEGLDAALKGSKFTVVARQQGFFDRAKAVAVVETAFQANSDISVVVDYAAAMSNGICQWLKDNKKDKILHVTSDADAEMITWFGTPYLTAARYYSSAQTGLIATQAVIDKLAGKTPTFGTPIDQVIATNDNIKDVVAKNPFFFDAYKDKVAKI